MAFMDDIRQRLISVVTLIIAMVLGNSLIRWHLGVWVGMLPVALWYIVLGSRKKSSS
jgi:uncharacterized membrane protein YdjX (TVP38/TMEM64 family)